MLSNKTTYTLFFTADLHGNIAQYTKLFPEYKRRRSMASSLAGILRPNLRIDAPFKGNKIFWNVNYSH